ncbi:hypothetical protein RB213_014427 [Colletotrichum asianum]
MGSHSPSSNQSHLLQRRADSDAAHAHISTTYVTRGQATKNEELEDSMSRYFGSSLPWNHVDAMSTSRDATIEAHKDGDKKEQDA